MKYSYKINNLKLFGFHGVYDKEQKEGQYFLIDVEFEVDYDISLLGDDLGKIIDYKIICDDITECFAKRCNLLETLISNIKSHLEKKHLGIIFIVNVKKEKLSLNHIVKSISVKNII